jgi:hypothetical protein
MFIHITSVTRRVSATRKGFIEDFYVSVSVRQKKEAINAMHRETCTVTITTWSCSDT